MDLAVAHSKLIYDLRPIRTKTWLRGPVTARRDLSRTAAAIGVHNVHLIASFSITDESYLCAIRAETWILVHCRIGSQPGQSASVGIRDENVAQIAVMVALEDNSPRERRQTGTSASSAAGERKQYCEQDSNLDGWRASLHERKPPLDPSVLRTISTKDCDRLARDRERC